MTAIFLAVMGEGFERWNLAAPTRLVEAGLKRLKDTMESL